MRSLWGGSRKEFEKYDGPFPDKLTDNDDSRDIADVLGCPSLLPMLSASQIASKKISIRDFLAKYSVEVVEQTDGAQVCFFRSL